MNMKMISPFVGKFKPLKLSRAVRSNNLTELLEFCLVVVVDILLDLSHKTNYFFLEVYLTLSKMNLIPNKLINLSKTDKVNP